MNLMESLIAQRLAGRTSGGGSNLTPDVKDALLDCFANVAWAVEDGQQYYDALADALYGLQSISAVYTQSGTVYDTDSLDSLKADLVVTALYGDGSTQTVPAESYTLSGTLEEGTSTIAVSYGGKTTTFNVVVTHKTYQKVEWIETDGASRIDTGVAFDGTKDFVLEMEAMQDTSIVYPSGTACSIGWNAGGNVGVFAASDRPIVWYWYNGLTPSEGANLKGVDQMTQIEMTIQAGTNTDTVIKCTNETGTKTITRTHPNVANRTFLDFPLFAVSAQSDFTFTPAGFRIKSATIKQGGVVVRNMYACYRLSDNVIGFYDEVTGTFYTNIGTGSFAKGSDIE